MAKPQKQPDLRREPTKAEAAAIAVAQAKHAARPARAAMDVTVKEAGVINMQSQHTDDNGAALLINEAFGTSSSDFATASLMHLVNSTLPAKGADTQTANAGMALVGAIGPQDELEAALALQMVATHELSMAVLARAKSTGRIDHMKEYGTLATKLTRTFATQMKTLADWRRGGEQVVRHIHVYEGGQAVIAETVNVGGQIGNSNVQPFGPGAGGPALLGQDPFGDTMPVPCDVGETALSTARRAVAGGA